MSNLDKSTLVKMGGHVSIRETIKPGTGDPYNIRYVERTECVELSIGTFEHLLNCLANQRYQIAPKEGVALTETQERIDDFWNQGMALLSTAKKSEK